MRYLSICSGIEAASAAWHSLEWKPFAFSEIEPFPCEVLKHHHPHVPNLGDMTRFDEWENLHEVDLLVGGTPCQAFSVAGLRNSLDDDRGNLTLTFVKILNKIDHDRTTKSLQPCIALWENVPGVFNTKDNAFGCFLGALAGEDLPLLPAGGKWSNAGAVYGPKRAIAWRVLDAQYFGVAQRRRRVFVVSSARDGFDPSKILFEFEGLRRDTPPSRETRQEITSATGGGFVGALCARDNKAVGSQFVDEGKVFAQAFNKQAIGQYSSDDIASTCAARDYKDATDLVTEAYALAGNTIERKPENGGNGSGFSKEVCYTLTKMDKHAVAQTMAVRRLTPTECERLQGFPDGHTLIPWRGKPADQCPDGSRYKALGNSMAVPVMAWIGQRINNYIHHEKRH